MPKRLAAILMAFALTATPLDARAPKVGEPAPPATIRTIDGRKVTIAELRGKVIVLNFWATWCVPCKTELPTLDAYYAIQREHGLEVFAVTTEDSLPPYQLKKLFAAMHLTPVRRIGAPYETLAGVPTNYVIDRKGVLRYAKAAAFDLDDLNTILVPLLNEPAPPA